MELTSRDCRSTEKPRSLRIVELILRLIFTYFLPIPFSCRTYQDRIDFFVSVKAKGFEGQYGHFKSMSATACIFPRRHRSSEIGSKTTPITISYPFKTKISLHRDQKGGLKDKFHTPVMKLHKTNAVLMTTLPTWHSHPRTIKQ